MNCRRTSALLIAIVAVAAMTAAPAWGRGLGGHLVNFSGHRGPGCGCGASQKGGGIIQKGGGALQKGRSVMQKGGGIIQKGGVAQKGSCGACQKGGGSRCGGCNVCCLNIIPTVINGVGSILDGLFTCNRCDTGCATKGGGSKGCSSCGGKGKHSGYYPMGSAPSSPFVEDTLMPPPVPMTEARVTRKAPIYSASTRARSKPRAIDVPAARLLRQVATETHVRQPAVVRANNIEEAEDDIPKNPLRD